MSATTQKVAHYVKKQMQCQQRTAGVDLHLGGLVAEDARRLLRPPQILHLGVARAPCTACKWFGTTYDVQWISPASRC